MSKISKEERRKALKERTSTNVENRDKGGFTGKRAVDFKGKEVTFWKPKKGKHLIDIIPYIVKTKNHPGKLKPGYEDYLLEYWVHHKVGPSEDAYLCLKKTFGKPCSICEEQASLIAGGSTWKDDDVKELNAKRRAMYNIIDLNDTDTGIQIFDVSHFLFEKELLEESEPDNGEEVIVFSDLEEGYSISFKAREKNQGGFSFIEFKSLSLEERDEQYDEDMLKESYSLDEYLVVPTYEEVRNAFHGIEEDSMEAEDDLEDDEEEEEEKPRKSKKQRSVKSDKAKHKNKCPHGHKFGQDCEEYEDCEDCDEWDDCSDAQEELDE